MEAQEIIALIDSLNLQEKIEEESIPNLDLYMDQVITLFEDKLSHTKRYSEDKLLTKTMINNYIKDKLLMPAVKKKYTKEHIMLMIILYELKQILSIGDIKSLFSTVVDQEVTDKALLGQVYESYIGASQMNREAFKDEVQTINHYAEEEVSKMSLAEESAIDMQKLCDVLQVILLTQKANYYKRLAEKIIDKKVMSKQEQQKKK